MQHSKIFSFICAALLMVFALTVLGPTDAQSAVSSKTASVKSNTKKHTVKSRSKKSKRRYAKKSRRRRRSRACNTEAGVKQAIELVRTQSVGLCKMTGLDYVAEGQMADSVRALLKTDAGEYDNPEDNSDDASDDVAVTVTSNNEVTSATMSPEDEADHAQELLEQEAEDDVIIDEESFKSLWLAYVDGGSGEVTEAGVEKQKLVDVIMNWLGTRYHFGGTTASGIDCSAFVREMYHATAGIDLPRTASEQSAIGIRIKDRKNLQFGDLVFFNTRRRVRVGHVGIYLGDHLFAHASSRFGVTISSLESTYYNKRFIGAARLDQHSVAMLAPLPGS